jgi:hypothetical protein
VAVSLGFVAGLIPPWFRLAAVAVAAGTLFIGGYRAGADRVRMQWHLEQAERERAAAEQHLRNERSANAAATDYRAARAARAARQPETQHALRNALSAPISCPPAASALGDVRIPAAVVDRLRDAGLDPQPAASGPGR